MINYMSQLGKNQPMNEILYSGVCFAVFFFNLWVFLKGGKKKRLAKRGQLALLQSNTGEL